MEDWDGSCVNVWRDLWLADDGNFFVQTPVSSEFRHVRVCDLMIANQALWDVSKLYALFSVEDVQRIQAIPLSLQRTHDKRIWHYSNNGTYSVKSGYNVAVDYYLNILQHIVPRKWLRLWSLKIPLKMKLFTWKALRDVLPMKSNLISRGVLVDSNCFSCGAVEDINHVMLSCPKAKECWDILNFNLQSFSFVDFHSGLLEQNDLFALLHAVSVAWSLWQHRNCLLWRGKSYQSAHVLHLASTLRQEWNLVKSNDWQLFCVADMGGRAEGRQKPALGRIKCNFDTSIFAGENLTGFATVVRNDTGHFVLGMFGFRSGNFSPPVAEALGLRERFLWLHNQGLDHVDVKMYCLSLFTGLSSVEENFSEVGSLIQDCLTLRNSFLSLSFHCTSRLANLAAHSLARVAKYYASFQLWFDVRSLLSLVLYLDSISGFEQGAWVYGDGLLTGV
ncbi:uncharacterized protein LOC110641985 [Hevea brasiliensis]|uniref:uncharacterized protein LOC110641985 n=1 Tax=Hevea brasiliensis TaxID=3981 RepID=UPI0025F51EC3|nr:uncharacterized protein LOC110641985 [Hevea brasiliensis]